MRRIRPRRRSNGITNHQQPYIHTIFASGPTGDVLDQAQQQDVLNKIFSHPPLPSGTPVTDAEAARIASLEYIWVFRRQSDHECPVWTTFDEDNQVVLSEHRYSDKGVEIFDSHIRQGQLPALVVPQRQAGYYLAGNDIASLEIACLPNSNNLQFVYRKPPRQ